MKTAPDQLAFPFHLAFLDPCLTAEKPPWRLDFGNAFEKVPERRQRQVFDALDICRKVIGERLAAPPIAKHEKGRRRVCVWDTIEIRIGANGRDLALLPLDTDPDAGVARLSADLARPIGSFSWTSAFDVVLARACREVGLNPKILPGPTGDAMLRALRLTFRRYVDFRALRRSLIQFLAPDPLTISLTRRTFDGVSAMADDFNWVGEHSTELAVIAIERPRLLPFIRFVRFGSDGESGPLIQSAERVFRRAGMEPVAWRKLELLGYDTFDEPADFLFFDCLEVIAQLANLFHRLQVREPPPAMFTHLAMCAADRLRPEVHEPIFARVPDWYLRALLNEVRRLVEEEGLDDPLPDGFERTLAWLPTRDSPPDPNQMRAGWGWIVAQAHGAEDRSIYPAWKVPWGDFMCGDYRIIALRDERALDDEGFALQNCLGDYSLKCASGRVVVFSIRQAATGERVACFSISRVDVNDAAKGWKLDQVAGKRNSQVSRSIGVVALAAVRRINEEASRA